MILNKRLPIILILLSVIAIIPFIAPKSEENTAVSAKRLNKPQIILDAGHGGFDGGAVANDGTVEKDINLKICVTLAEFLRFGGYDVIMTRSDDISTDDVDSDKIATRKKSDLKNRLELMKNNPDAIFVSIHLNKFTTSTASGSQVFYSGKCEESAALGEAIQSAIVGLLQPTNTRVNKKATSSTYLLYNATVPAVLVECGFLSNAGDLQKLKDKDYQKKMAFSIFCGITRYFTENNAV